MRLSPRVASIEASQTLAVAERAAKMREEGRDIVSLSAGEPDFDTPEHIKEAARRAIAEGKTKYTPSSGIAPLRKAIAAKLERENGLAVRPQDIVVSCGSKHALYNVLAAALADGDEVLIPAPYWTSYPEMVKAAGGSPVCVMGEEAQDFKAPASLLARHVTPRTRMILVNTPGNPTGSVYDETELREIGELAVKRDLLVVTDEIYEKVLYEGRHVCLAALSPALAARTAVVNGVSKAYAMTGWRIGYAAGPSEWIEAAGRLQTQVTSNASSISQYAALAALEGPADSTVKMTAEFHARRDLLVGRLGALAGFRFVRPSGAFYLFADVSAAYGDGLGGSVAFCERLLEEEGLALVPGAAFGSDRHVRFTFAASRAVLESGIARFSRFWSQRGHGRG